MLQFTVLWMLEKNLLLHGYSDTYLSKNEPIRGAFTDGENFTMVL